MSELSIPLSQACEELSEFLVDLLKHNIEEGELDYMLAITQELVDLRDDPFSYFRIACNYDTSPQEEASS